MYRFIIVDDEEVIRNGLSEILDWESFGFTPVGTFSNGNSALAYLRKHPVDVVLADIRMPRLSGLDLARVLLTEKPDCYVVIMSGYDEFRFAQEAIDLNVFKYLLKPIKEEQLQKVFLRIRELLEAPESRTKHVRKMDGLRERDYEAWLSSGVVSDPPVVLDNVSDTSSSAKYSVVLFEPVLQIGAAEESVDLMGVCASLRRVIDEMCSEGIVRASIVRDSVQLSVVFVLDRSPEFPRNAFAIATGEIASYDDVFLSAAVSKPVAGLRELPVAFRQAEAFLVHRMYLGLDRLIFPEDCNKKNVELMPNDSSGLYTSEDVDQLGRAIETHDTEVLSATIKSLTDRWKSAAVTDPGLIEGTVISLITRVSERAAPSIKGVASLFPGDQQLRHELHGSLSLDEYERRLNRILLAVIRSVEEGADGPNVAVVRAIKYIGEKFDSDFSLDDVADAVGVSSGYLSRLFRKATGETFKSYVTRFRIQEAKRLLTGSTERVYEIARRTGYNDQHYFSEVFRKETGLSPREYRSRFVGNV